MSDGDRGSADVDSVPDGRLIDELHRSLHELEQTVEEHEHRSEIRRIRGRTQKAIGTDVFGQRIRKYTGRDIAEAFVGSVFFAIPLLVEDGVFDVAAFFLGFRLGRFPVFFVLNALFVLGMILAIIYWTGLQDVTINRPLFGFIPRRLVGISLVSFLTAAALMTMWGRVGNWHDPVVAIARISAVWTVASFGAALGDILPGESSGDDINDDLEEFGEQARDLVSETV